MAIMPAPIALVLAEYEAEDRPFRKLHRLVDAYETVLKYTAVLGVQNFYFAELAESFPETNNRILERISRPMLGDWAGFAREVLRCFSEREQDLFSRDLFLFHFRHFGPKAELQRHFTDQGASGRLLALRNRLAHGATLSDEESAALVIQSSQDLSTLLERAAFLGGLPLYCVGERVAKETYIALPLMGTDYSTAAPTRLLADSLTINRLVAYNPQSGSCLNLHPLLVFVECEEELVSFDKAHHHVIGRRKCRQRKVLFYNDLREQDRIAFLDYWRGHSSRFKPPSPLSQEFRDQFPPPKRVKRQANWFDSLIGEWTANFVGRESELDSIGQFVSQSSKGVLVVTGAPGLGKSALLAKWAHENNAARHFIREGDAATSRIERIFTNLGLQLSEQFKLQWKEPKQLEPIFYREVFEELLSAAAAASSDRVVLVIDGLDEALRSLVGAQDSSTILDYLPDPAYLPAGVRLILSIRPELLDHSTFAAKFGADKAVWLTLSPLSDKNIRALLYQVHSKYEVLDAEAYVDAIVKRSEGNPLYLRMLSEDLVEGHLTFGEIGALPQGIIAYYARILKFIERLGHAEEPLESERELKTKREILNSLVEQGLLTSSQAALQLDRKPTALGARTAHGIELLALFCLVREPLSLIEAASILGVDQENAEHAFEFVRTVLVGGSSARFSIFHSGFREYFLHLDRYIETNIHRYRETIALIQAKVVDYCTRWKEHESDYALRHASEHLREAKRWDELFSLARDGMFLRSQTKKFPLEPDMTLLTLKSAIRGAIEIDDAVAMAEFVLAHSGHLNEIKQQTPLEVLRAGNLGLALKLSDLYDNNRCILWHLLLAWELNDDGKSEQARNVLEGLLKKDMVALYDLNEVAGIILAAVSDINPKLFELLRGPILNDYGHRKAAKLLIDFNRFQLAVEEARAIEDMGERSKALRETAEAQFLSGQKELARTAFAQAAEAALGHEYDWGRIAELTEIASAQMRLGEQAMALRNLEEAFKLTAEISDQERRDKQLDGVIKTFLDAVPEKIVTGKQSRSGLRGFFQRFGSSSGKQPRSEGRIFSTTINAARMISAPERRVGTLVNIACAQAKAGIPDQAERTIADVLQMVDMSKQDETSKAIIEAGAKIVVARLKAGMETGRDLDALCKVAFMTKSDMFKEIAVACAAAGLFNRADEIVRRITDQRNAVRALIGIAEIHALAGNHVKARMMLNKAIERIDVTAEYWWPFDALIAIATLQLRLGNPALTEGILAKAIDLAGAATAYNEVGAILAQMGNLNEAQRVFDLAIQCAKEEEVNQRRADHLRQVAVAQKRAGLIEPARQTRLEAIECASNNPYYGDGIESLLEIAEAFIIDGESRDARLALANLLKGGNQNKEEWDRAEVLVQIGAELSKSGNTEMARLILLAVLNEGTRIPNRHRRGTVLSSVATALADFGEIDHARLALTGAIEAVSQGWILTEAMHQVAEALYSIVVAQAEAGDTTGATKTFYEEMESIDVAGLGSYYEGKFRCTIALVQAKAQNFEVALETARKIEQKRTRAETLCEVGAAQMQAGSQAEGRRTFSEALETARQIDEDDDRVNTLRALAIILARVNVLDLARDYLNEALEIVNRIAVPMFCAAELSRIAASLALNGDQQHSLATFARAHLQAQQLQKHEERALALMTIAAAEHEAGETRQARETFNSALETARAITDPYERSRSICLVADGLIRSGDPDQAPAILNESIAALTSQEGRSGAMTSIATALARAKFGGQAVVATHDIQIDRPDSLSQVAEVLSDVGDRLSFKELLIPCAGYRNSAYRVCGLLAKLYPSQSIPIVQMLLQ